MHTLCVTRSPAGADVTSRGTLTVEYSGRRSYPSPERKADEPLPSQKEVLALKTPNKKSCLPRTAANVRADAGDVIWPSFLRALSPPSVAVKLVRC